ncbi:MAG: hypothetical protein JWM11_5743 [Planctomycetaceae bacterium]|nr:hypothetical protein [Planctomycetaceae bacterium]
MLLLILRHRACPGGSTAYALLFFQAIRFCEIESKRYGTYDIKPGFFVHFVPSVSLNTT